MTHIAIEGSLEAAMSRVTKGGGSVASEVVKISAGTFFYAHDSEGNTLGIFKF